MAESTSFITDLKGKTAVITGAGSGFGRAFALHCAREGMKLALADVNEKDLAETVAQAEALGAECLSQRCDVSKAGDVEQLAVKTFERFGATNLLFNNAGVSVAGPAWMNTLEDWQWNIGVNLMGVVHGVKSFVPRMLDSGQPGHIVNTASIAGLVTVVGSAVYCATKHAVVAMTECLDHDLRLAKAPIGVSVLCPGFVQTGIADSERNRPADMADANPLSLTYLAEAKKAMAASPVSIDDVINATMNAVRERRFYILTHPYSREVAVARGEGIRGEMKPFMARF
jgi:NAD(P)-dependent dehydrogenase (short-subunit alcohol dehydrogenase family)